MTMQHRNAGDLRDGLVAAHEDVGVVLVQRAPISLVPVPDIVFRLAL